MLLHTFHDRSVLRRISARDLIKIPIWKGNRTIEVAHAEEIFCAIGGNVRCLDSSIFRIVKYMEMNASGALQEQKYIIDGQLQEKEALDNVKPLANLLREANSTIRWIMVH